jgi:DNA-binding transcriptional regulator YdaS (Cro superfamily)
MDLLTYISDMGRRRALAKHMKRNPVYLWQVATGRRRASTELAKEIQAATTELGPEPVPRASLRPDVWDEPVTAPASSRGGKKAAAAQPSASQT